VGLAREFTSQQRAGGMSEGKHYFADFAPIITERYRFSLVSGFLVGHPFKSSRGFFRAIGLTTLLLVGYKP
jgi:hypothetical protein